MGPQRRLARVLVRAVLTAVASASVGAFSFFVTRLIMDLHVKFDGKEIIVTKPGTDFMLPYRKPTKVGKAYRHRAGAKSDR